MRIVISWLIIVVLFSTGCRKNIDNDHFVRVEGTIFMIGDEAYRFAGINFWHGAYLGADLVPGGKERLVRELDLLKSYGIDNLRVMAASEESSMQMSVYPAFQVSPGEYNRFLFTSLDFLLDEMQKRDMKAVLVLNNYWQWSGGMAQYLSWATGDSVLDPDASGDWHGFMRYSAEFYNNADANEMFFRYLKEIISRRNSINGKLYSEDPVIMSWELANEPRPHPQGLKETERLRVFYKWIDTTARFIRKLAPNQLITTGSEGLAGSLSDSAVFFNSHSLPSVDYITFHLWPKNWGWYNAHDPEGTLPGVLQNATDYYLRHIKFAKLMNKPIVLEEFGIGRDFEDYLPGSPVTVRDTFYHVLFSLIEQDVKNNKPIAGTNIWTWGGEGRAHRADFKWIKGTDYTGDPPQEPQGLNSVFDTDTSTLNLIRDHALFLKNN
ncbi:MAG: cellulase family glycosylhydrolase [Bacteroidales bacterium]|nr:cellulase family glycosylhydrolase [Bacteroidales bacterium]